MKTEERCGVCGKTVSLLDTYYKPIPQKTAFLQRNWFACTEDHAHQIETNYPKNNGVKVPKAEKSLRLSTIERRLKKLLAKEYLSPRQEARVKLYQQKLGETCNDQV